MQGMTSWIQLTEARWPRGPSSFVSQPSKSEHRSDSSRVFGLYAWEVPFGKGATGAGFEVALETNSFRLRRELHRHQESPGPISPCVSLRPLVMPSQPVAWVAGRADVVTSGVGLAAQDVDVSSFFAKHRCITCTRRAAAKSPGILRTRLNRMQFLQCAFAVHVAGSEVCRRRAV